MSVDGVIPEESSDSRAREHLMASIEAWVSSKYKALQKHARHAPTFDRQAELEAAEELARYVRKLTGIRPFVIFHGVDGAAS